MKSYYNTLDCNYNFIESLFMTKENIVLVIKFTGYGKAWLFL